jgi:hypothetical protein
MISNQQSREIIDALRRGVVPKRGLGSFAVGLDPFEQAVDDELQGVSAGGGVFKAIRGEYGSGKTFFSRWLQERARQKGFATSEVQISETETPLHRLETVYRRLMERLSTADTLGGAFKQIIDGWFYTLEEDVLAGGLVAPDDEAALLAKTDELMEQRLAAITQESPTFAAVLRGYRKAQIDNDLATADGLIAWVTGQPNVGAAVKRFANIKGNVDHFGALNFLQGILVILKDSGHAGLLVVLDEVETLQRVRTDVREKGLNALRQLIDEVDAGRFPGLYLVITGTPAFYDGPQGVQRLAPLAQRLHVDFGMDAKFDNPRAVQIRLKGFDHEALVELGMRVRDIYAGASDNAERIQRLADRAYVAALATAVTGNLGGKVGVAPRIFLKKLVGEVLDRIDQFPDFDPSRDYTLTMASGELTETERNQAPASSVDDIELNL